MGVACDTQRNVRNANQILFGSLNGIDCLEGHYLDGRAILKLISKK